MIHAHEDDFDELDHELYDPWDNLDPDDEVEVFLVKRTLIKTGHEFVLDELVCHDFGEPKGQCAVCGGYCKYD